MRCLAAESDSDTIAVFIYRAETAKRRNRLAGLPSKSNHDGVVNNPVAARQFVPQGKFRFVWCFCFDVAQPVGNSVYMGIDTNAVFAVSKRYNEIGGFAANALDA